jgi:hypothetical protein
MKRLGVADDINGHAVLAEHFTQATKDSNNIVKKYTDQYGSFEIRNLSLLALQERPQCLKVLSKL